MGIDPAGYYYSAADAQRLATERARRKAQQDALLSTINAGVAQRVTSITQQYPTAGRGTVQVATRGQSSNEELEALVMREAEQGGGNWLDKATGFLGDKAEAAGEFAYHQILKPTVRTLFTAIDGAAQELVQRPLTAVLAAAGDGPGGQGIADSYQQYGNSAAVEAVQGLAQGQGLDGLMGEGFFAGGRAQAESSAQRTLMTDGKKATLGRQFTSNTVGQFVDPSSTAYATTEFLSQLVFDIGLDPTVLLTGGLSKAPLVGKRIGQSIGKADDLSRGQTLLKDGVQGLRQAKKGDFTPAEQRAFRQGFAQGGPLDRESLDKVLRESFPDAPSLNSGGGRPNGITRAVRQAREGDPKGALGPEGRPVFGLTDHGTLGEDGVRRSASGERLMAAQHGKAGEEPLRKVYRGMSVEEYEQATQRGFISSDGRGVISKAEGTNAAADPSTAYNYLPRDARGVIVEIDVHPDDAWFTTKHDSYLRSRGQIPISRVSKVSPVLEKSGNKVFAVGEKFSPEMLARAVGAIESPYRRTVLQEKVRTLTENEDLLDAIVGMDAADVLRVVTSNQKTRGMDASHIKRLANTKTREEATEVLAELVGGGKVRDMRAIKGFGEFKRESFLDHQMFGNTGERLRKFTGLSASGKLSEADLAGSALRVDSVLKQVNVPAEARRKMVNKFLTHGDDETVLFDNLVEEAFKVAGQHMDNGALADQMFKVAKHQVSTVRNAATSYLRRHVHSVTADATDQEIITAATLLNDGVAFPTAQFLNQLSDAAFYIDMKQVQQMRRNAVRSNSMRKLAESKGWTKFESGTRMLTLGAFKPLVLLRPAFAAREFLDAQMRLAGSNVDYDTMLTSPLRFFSAVRASKKEMKTFMGADIQKSAQDMNVLAQDMHGLLNLNNSARTTHMGAVGWAEAGDTVRRDTMLNAWRWNIQHYAADEGINRLARSNFDVEKWIDTWALSDEGRTYFGKLANASDSHRRAYSNLDSPEGLDALRKLGEGAREMLIGGVKEGDKGLLGGINSPLVDIFAKGGAKVGKTQRSLFKKADSKHLNRFFDHLADDYAPRSGLMAPILEETGQAAARADERTFMEFLGAKFMTDPANNWSRYPALRGRLIKNSTEMISEVKSPALRKEIADQLAEDFNFTRFERADLKRAMADADNRTSYALDEIEGIEDFDQLVRGRSMNEALDDLFDISDRSEMQQSFGAIMPFYDAYIEALESYGRIARDNPAFFAKGMQGYQSMREQGMFFVDDNGEERFTMPGGGALTAFVHRWNEAGGSLHDMPLAAGGAVVDALTGNKGNTEKGGFSQNLEGRVQGLNIVLQGIGPGFGPMVSWGAGALLPKSEGFETIREFVNPFGSEFNQAHDIADVGAYFEALLPAHAQKWLNALTGGKIDPVQHNTAVGDAMNVLAETGMYDPANPTERNRMVDDAKRAGNFLMLVRGVSQAIAPTGPSATWRFQPGVPAPGMPTEWDMKADPDGRALTLHVLGEEYRRIGKEYGYEEAGAMFFEMYGVEPWYVTQSGTNTTISGMPVTREGDRWIDAHDGAARRYPAVVGYFAPAGAEDEFDYSVYRRQIEEGKRDLLSLDQQAALATQTKARQLYYNYRRQIEGAGVKGKQKTMLLNTVKQQLETQFPGWTLGVPGVSTPTTIVDRIKMLSEAAFDPELADSPITPGLRKYIEARDAAEAYARQRSGGTAVNLGAVRDADMLDALRDYGTMLAVSDPDFRGVWEAILSKEMDQ